MKDWYAWTHFGADPAPAKGPFQTIDEARGALERFRGRYGALAGTYERSGRITLKIYVSRESARNADIGDNAQIAHL